MARYNGRILFIDGFAGPGRYSGGEEGSPLIALRALLEHPHFQNPTPNQEVAFLFIEEREDRASALELELSRFSETRPIPKWVKYDVLQGQFASLMIDVLERLDREGKRLAPTFAFIDPFGFSGVPLNVIARIVQNPRCECLITFMYESINRFLAHPSEAIRAHFDELFGTDGWRDILEGRDAGNRRDEIVSLYRTQLIDQAKLKYVRIFEMINEGNRTEYFLYFGSNSLSGYSKMKEAMWRVDPISGQVFSDRTDAREMVLFEFTPNLSSLQKLLSARFRGAGWVDIDQVRDFVLMDTPFSEAIHLKHRTLKPMERADPPLIVVERPKGARNRPGDYPSKTKIRFL